MTPDFILRQLLERRGFVVLASPGSTLPDVVAIQAGRRPIAIDIVPSLLEDSVATLNRKVGALRQVTPQLEDARVSRVVVDLSASATARFTGPPDREFLDDWIRSVPEEDLDDAVVEAVISALQPDWALTIPSRTSLHDGHAAANAAHRIVLDEHQQAAAQQMSSWTTVISGPPGSGKTLVLAARARWLARAHPDWDIRLLCYNRVLVPYLRSLVADAPRVTVSTFGRFASGLGVRISLDDEAAAFQHVEDAVTRVKPCVDAVLIDEAQDFMVPWIEFVRAVLRPDRGGLVMAGDPHQALYRDSSWITDLESGAIQRVTLQRPYRSTRPILAVTQAFDPSLSISGLAEAVEGEPADLVWANSTRGQVDAVVADVGLLVDAGMPLADIGILVTRKWRQSGVARALSAAGFATEIIYPRDAEVADLSRPTIKVLTTHSAKGYEFGAVILVGLEDLPNPDGLPEHDRQMRTAYVGATRARDRLIITYTKVNDYLERIRSVPPTILRRWTYPDDYGIE